MKIRKQVAMFGRYFMSVVDISNFSLKKTLECGQTFRWKVTETGWYYVVNGQRDCYIRQMLDLSLSVNSEEDVEYWLDYFDLHVDYTSMFSNVDLTEFERKCVIQAEGLRILRQPKFETGVAYLISQNNNIARIRKAMEALCQLTDSAGFPTAEILGQWTLQQWEEIGVGYRARYLVEFCQWVASRGEEVLEGFSELSSDQLLEQLQMFAGVGPKVSNCIALFAYGRKELFPVDVWIQKVVDRFYNGKLDSSRFGEYAGVMQEYMYYVGRLHPKLLE